ncbi:MAG: hypothetical protein UY35_C0008G0045 [Candidatus Saccharibacteria bacterium GW2011_GWC2_48_9]|nr:MAG: hypothetical protein UY35_C0008G0045 [Candidatus Saccharibacteria bacterium GW2011_GWC2_48_9]
MSASVKLKIFAASIAITLAIIDVFMIILVYSQIRNPIGSSEVVSVFIAIALSVVFILNILYAIAVISLSSKKAVLRAEKLAEEERCISLGIEVVHHSSHAIDDTAVTHEFFAEQARVDRVQFVYGFLAAFLVAFVAVKLLRRR